MIKDLTHNLYILYEESVIKSWSLTRLGRTTTIRLTLRYSIYYAVLITVVLAIIYLTTNNFVESYFQSRIEKKMIELINVEKTEGRINLVQIIDSESQLINDGSYHFYLMSNDGKKIAGNLLNWPSQLIIDGKAHKMALEPDFYPEIIDAEEGLGYWLMAAKKLDDGSKLLLARYVDDVYEIQEFILFLIIIVIPLSGLLAITLGLLLGRTILNKIDNISTTAKAISSGDFNHRVSVTGRNDEFDELASHLNNMLARIQKLIEGMRRVTDNIAHDLRSPLSRIRNNLDVTLLEKRDESEYIEVIKSAIEDTEQLIHTFNALLEIAQTEAGNYRGDWNNVHLSSLVYDIGKLYQDIAEENELIFELNVEPNIIVQGNRHLLAQAISNVLDNSIKYTNKSGCIRMSLNYVKHQPCLSISDTGPGIPPDKRDFVMERFSRLDDARHASGNGLGLSLVKAVANIHKAELSLLDNAPGVIVTLLFPISELNKKQHQHD